MSSAGTTADTAADVATTELNAAAKRSVYISASSLAFSWTRVPKPELAHALFFFGSKRSWLFPSTDEQRADSRRQPTDYNAFDPGFKELILEKEGRGEVFFLKPDSLDYKG